MGALLRLPPSAPLPTRDHSPASLVVPLTGGQARKHEGTPCRPGFLSLPGCSWGRTWLPASGSPSRDPSPQPRPSPPALSRPHLVDAASRKASPQPPDGGRPLNTYSSSTIRGLRTAGREGGGAIPSRAPWQPGGPRTCPLLSLRLKHGPAHWELPPGAWGSRLFSLHCPALETSTSGLMDGDAMTLVRRHLGGTPSGRPRSEALDPLWAGGF